MDERIRTSPEIGEIATALAIAQKGLQNVVKSGKNPHFKSNYATLPDSLAEVRPKLAKEGIAIFQAAVNGEGGDVGVVTRLIHNSGQWLESSLFVAPTKFDAQGVGSVITYLRRYTLMAAAGIAGDDDDGEAAVGRPEGRSAARQRAEANWGGQDSGTASQPTPRAGNGAAPPPHDPVTGEVRPVEVPLRMVGDKHNFLSWGQTLIAGIKTATTGEELDEWERLNEPGIAMSKGSAAGRSVAAALAKAREGLAAESVTMVTEETAGSVLG